MKMNTASDYPIADSRDRLLGGRHRRRHLSMVCAPPLVFCRWDLSEPSQFSGGWAKFLKVVYYYHDLQQSYAEAKNSGQTLPLGQADIDGHLKWLPVT